MNKIKLYNKEFILYINHNKIQESVKNISNNIYNFYKNETPIFIGVLSGVIMFMSDLLKYYPGNCEVSFIKLNSYRGIRSSKKVVKDIKININIINRHVVILEDIIDTGNTLEVLLNIIKNKPLKSLKIVSLFFKPGVFKKKISIDIIGINLSNKFVIGYGLDYNGLGRNFRDLYQLKS